MTLPSWQLNTPVSAIVFDCDGTLSSIEGIDFLAKNNGVGEAVKLLTSEAMGKSGLNPSLYQQRLDLVFPRREQVYALGHQYFAHRVPDISDIINLFKRLNKSIYLVSAGVNPAVRMFGEMLQIPLENVYAVDLRFDQQGNFLDFERNSPLISNDGKRAIVQQIKAQHQDIIHIGDGLNDIVTLDLVTRFIGYGGVAYRKNIAELCKYYIKTLSFTPLIPLVLTQEECANLLPEELSLYQKGLAAINEGSVQLA
ncbi:MAG: HAD-IB family phosphatase [Gammaproteobacteria bacterium]|nr:HAD-IB family phosphatase [Gammaproteobacteria bacterium]MCW5583666.1 HAD-IB family phosphatase [Gammaproteobacteria bacterium]